jgi:hypothetical protein
MKPSDIKARQPQSEASEPLRMSAAADPPITEAEARAASAAICRRHNGLIRLTGDKPDAVFFCPIGKQYWRYSKKDGAHYKSIAYSSKGIV